MTSVQGTDRPEKLRRLTGPGGEQVDHANQEQQPAGDHNNDPGHQFVVVRELAGSLAALPDALPVAMAVRRGGLGFRGRRVHGKSRSAMARFRSQDRSLSGPQARTQPTISWTWRTTTFLIPMAITHAVKSEILPRPSGLWPGTTPAGIYGTGNTAAVAAITRTTLRRQGNQQDPRPPAVPSGCELGSPLSARSPGPAPDREGQ
jgi:hypothetical protein